MACVKARATAQRVKGMKFVQNATAAAKTGEKNALFVTAVAIVPTAMVESVQIVTGKDGKPLTQKTSDINRVYWAGVWFAFGLGSVVAQLMGVTAGAKPGLIVAAFALSFGSWYTSGILVAAMLIAIFEKVR